MKIKILPFCIIAYTTQIAPAIKQSLEIVQLGHTRTKGSPMIEDCPIKPLVKSYLKAPRSNKEMPVILVSIATKKISCPIESTQATKVRVKTK